MERHFIIDRYNSWLDWRSILSDKDITPPEPKTNLVELDGMSGSLDLSESLSGEITYKDRIVSSQYWTDYGSYKDREKLLQDIVRSLHGKKVKIIEPDDPYHYFYGRVSLKARSNNLAYATYTLEATCDPWRYSLDETERRVEVNSSSVVDVVVNNNGVKSVCPEITIKGSVNIIHNGITTPLIDGTYKISDVIFRQGVTVIGVSGNGSATFKYREAEL